MFLPGMRPLSCEALGGMAQYEQGHLGCIALSFAVPASLGWTMELEEKRGWQVREQQPELG